MSGRLAWRTLRRPQGQSAHRLNLYRKAPRTSPYWAPHGGRHYQSDSTLRILRCPRKLSQISYAQRKTFLTDTIPSILIPPIVFAGLVLALWTWKCLMMVLFQDRIIYMPSMPPFARSEKMDDYTPMCKPVEWEQRHIKSLDGTKIALCLGRVPETARARNEEAVKEVVMCYFQGNGSSLPPRLPILSNVLKSVEARTAGDNTQIRYTVLALSYRGYWTSSGRASQAGIELDAQALLSYASTNLKALDNDTQLILWGQSIGSGVAATAAAKYIQHSSTGVRISALVLETPFTSVKSMLIALYPQKWLPYRYLWPFLWNHWDSETALRQIVACQKNIPKVLILPATRDEVVPSEEADKLERLCRDLKLDFERRDVEGALHSEATLRRDGQEAIAKFVADVIQSK